MHNKEEPLCESAQCTCKYMTGEQSGSDEVRRDLVWLKNCTKSMHNKEEPLCESAQCTCKYMTGEQSGSDEVRRDLVRF